MSDERPPTLADVLQQRDDVDQLARSVPSVPRNLTGDLNALHSWITRNVLSPAQYALLYPQRIMQRHGDPTGRDRFYYPQPGNFAMEQLRPSYEAIARKDPGYVPGERESTNVEDRIPRSIWPY